MTTPKITPMDRISEGYRQMEPELDARRQRRIASGFRESDRMEQLLRLKARDPATYARLDATTRMAVGSYEQTKRIAQEMEDDHGNDAA
jgi:hypothetical protein